MSQKKRSTEHLKDHQFKKGNKAAEKQFDWVLLDKLLARRMSQIDCAELLNVSIDTVSRQIEKKHGVTFAEYRLLKLAPTKLSLVEKALHLALEKNNTQALFFCLKNLCGWSDKPEESNLEKPKQVITLNYSLDTIPTTSRVIKGDEDNGNISE